MINFLTLTIASVVKLPLKKYYFSLDFHNTFLGYFLQVHASQDYINGPFTMYSFGLTRLNSPFLFFHQT